MNRPTGDRPEDQLERLLASGATDFERRVLESALQKKPSSASSARMAKALGVTAATIGSATAATTLAAGATATKGVAAAGATAWPWVTLGVIGLAVAGAVVGTRTGHEARPPQTVPSVMAPVMQAPEPVLPTEPAVAEPSPRATTPTQRAHSHDGHQRAEGPGRLARFGAGSGVRGRRAARARDLAPLPRPVPGGQLSSGSRRHEDRGAAEARSRGGSARTRGAVRRGASGQLAQSAGSGDCRLAAAMSVRASADRRPGSPRR